MQRVMNISGRKFDGPFVAYVSSPIYTNCVHHVLTQIAAQTFVQEKEYGLALSYSSSAEDWPGLGRVVDRVLEEYITAGMNSLSLLAWC
jgi:hypothetical protein